MYSNYIECSSNDILKFEISNSYVIYYWMYYRVLSGGMAFCAHFEVADVDQVKGLSDG